MNEKWYIRPLFVFLGIVLFLLAAGISINAVSQRTGGKFDNQPDVVMHCMDPAIPEAGVKLWKKEIARRFHCSVGIVVHGGEFVEGQWLVKTSGLSSCVARPAAEVVRHYQGMYPNRTIVLISCNPGHLSLGVPGVWYARANVWVVPDREMTPENTGMHWAFFGKSRWEEYPDAVGSIFEFVCDM